MTGKRGVLHCICIRLIYDTGSDTPPPRKAGDDKVSEEEDWTWLIVTCVCVLAVVASVCVSAYVLMRRRKRHQAEVEAAAAANPGHYTTNCITKIITGISA